MTTNLLKKLPQEIEDMIGMYNCEHRPQMKKVLKEMKEASFWKFRYTMILYGM